MILFFCLLLGFARGQELFVEDYGTPPTGVESESELYTRADLAWLYDLIMPEEFRRKWPSDTQRSFEVHIVDTFGNFHHPDLLRNQNLNPAPRIEGKITYVGFFRKKYQYDVFKDKDGPWVMNVRVHFKDATEEDIKKFTAHMADAEALWNRFRPERDFSFRFLFEIVSDKAKAHYSVSIKDDTRGPYDSYWGRNWNKTIVAHELGHMMGLGDEYKTLTGRVPCIRESLMCDGFMLFPYHYYFILRRLVSASAK